MYICMYICHVCMHVSVHMLGSSLIYEEGDDADDFQEILARQLSACPAGGIIDGSMLTVEDFTQNLEVCTCTCTCTCTWRISIIVCVLIWMCI